jgi:hypothetical protein
MKTLKTYAAIVALAFVLGLGIVATYPTDVAGKNSGVWGDCVLADCFCLF